MAVQRAWLIASMEDAKDVILGQNKAKGFMSASASMQKWLLFWKLGSRILKSASCIQLFSHVCFVLI